MMAGRLCIRSLSAAAQLNLGKCVVNEGLIGGEDRAQLELVCSAKLGALLAKPQCMLTSRQSCVLRDELAAYSIFFIKE